MTRKVTITNTSNWANEPIHIMLDGDGIPIPSKKLNTGESYEVNVNDIMSAYISSEFEELGNKPGPFYNKENGEQVYPFVEIGYRQMKDHKEVYAGDVETRTRK